MDVNQDTVVKTMMTHDCLRLIHGHTHRPNVHRFEVNGKPAQRHVLAVWQKNVGEALVWDEKGYRVEVT